MLRKGSLHARETEPLPDGRYRAVTLVNRPPHGVMAWAGIINARAADKGVAHIEIGDYEQVEKVSFCQWADVWEYFADRQYDEILVRLRAEVERLYPGE